MARIGSKNGPLESELVDRLGAAYFGISEEDLEAEIRHYKDTERGGEIAPVRRDPSGRYYIIFCAPNGGTQNFYLDEHGITLEGEVRIRDEEATSVEIKP